MASVPVPVIDLTSARQGHGRVATAAALDEACSTSGFFAITGHGVDRGLIDEMCVVGRDFFTRPDGEKARVAPTDGAARRGFLAMNTTALASTLGDVTPPDLSESFSVGCYDEGVAVGPDAPDEWSRRRVNRWPHAPASLRPTFERYLGEMRPLTADVLRLLALSLELPEDFFVPPFARPNSTALVMNYYPALTEPPRQGQLRRGAHTDYGIITVLYAEEEPGLQISFDGEWYDVPPVEHGFVVNLGDLMARWVNDRWRSTLHRVVVPAGRQSVDRISIPFFVHPDIDTLVDTVPATISAVSPARYGAVVGAEWIAAKSRSMMETTDT